MKKMIFIIILMAHNFPVFACSNGEKMCDAWKIHYTCYCKWGICQWVSDDKCK